MQAWLSDISVLWINTFIILRIILSSTLHLVVITAIVINVLVGVIGIHIHILQHTTSTTLILLFLSKSILPNINKIMLDIAL